MQVSHIDDFFYFLNRNQFVSAATSVVAMGLHDDRMYTRKEVAEWFGENIFPFVNNSAEEDRVCSFMDTMIWQIEKENKRKKDEKKRQRKEAVEKMTHHIQEAAKWARVAKELGKKAQEK